MRRRASRARRLVWGTPHRPVSVWRRNSKRQFRGGRHPGSGPPRPASALRLPLHRVGRRICRRLVERLDPPRAGGGRRVGRSRGRGGPRSAPTDDRRCAPRHGRRTVAAHAPARVHPLHESARRSFFSRYVDAHHDDAPQPDPELVRAHPAHRCRHAGAASALCPDSSQPARSRSDGAVPAVAARNRGAHRGAGQLSGKPGLRRRRLAELRRQTALRTPVHRPVSATALCGHAVADVLLGPQSGRHSDVDGARDQRRCACRDVDPRRLRDREPAVPPADVGGRRGRRPPRRARRLRIDEPVRRGRRAAQALRRGGAAARVRRHAAGPGGVHRVCRRSVDERRSGVVEPRGCVGADRGRRVAGGLQRRVCRTLCRLAD